MSRSGRARGLVVLLVLVLVAAASLVAVKRERETLAVLDRPDDEIGLFIWGDMPVNELASTGLVGKWSRAIRYARSRSPSACCTSTSGKAVRKRWPRRSASWT